MFTQLRDAPYCAISDGKCTFMCSRLIVRDTNVGMLRVLALAHKLLILLEENRMSSINLGALCLTEHQTRI